MHRDIKLANILLKGDGHIVLSDFGLSKRFAKPSVIGGAVLPWSWMSRPKTPEEREMYHAREGCGTPQTMAPEIIQGKPYTFEVDYWALAVVMHLMLLGRVSDPSRSYVCIQCSFDDRHLLKEEEPISFGRFSTDLSCSGTTM